MVLPVNVSLLMEMAKLVNPTTGSKLHHQVLHPNA